MTVHTGLPVAGYTPQTDTNVELVNRTKQLEERVLRHLDALVTDSNHDLRMLSIARTKSEEAFMWANRAVSQPKRVALPEDSDYQGE
jgi:hypothetical protein